jgi:hypothetical protein
MKYVGKKAVFTARFAQDAEHAEKKVVKNKTQFFAFSVSLRLNRT